MNKRKYRNKYGRYIRMKYVPRVRRERVALTILFAVLVFLVLLLVVLVSAVLIVILLKLNAISMADLSLNNLSKIVWFMALVCVVVGMISAYFFGRILVKPANEVINCMNRLADGDYKARVAFKGPFASHEVIQEFTDSFNTMASELENTEMMRADFVNDFSHEFKTPIVSISGFAKLLRRGNVSDAERDEYLGIIEDESLRLARMATNTLNLTRVEKQAILTDVTRYNLSEQLRSCMLLLEDKWSRKNLELDLDFEEYEIEANQELMKQVWLNLMDNAVKFTPEGGCIRVSVEPVNPDDGASDVVSRSGEAPGEHHLSVSILNTGSEIPSESLDRIFQKFYKADPSHSGEGNGIGLALVKRVIDLHGGTVTVQSHDSTTTFTVKM